MLDHSVDGPVVDSASSDISSLASQIALLCFRDGRSDHRERRGKEKHFRRSEGRGEHTHSRDLFVQKEINIVATNNVAAVLTAVVDAAAFPSAEKQKLEARVQSRQASDDEGSRLSAPVAVACASHSSDSMDVLDELVDKPQIQLDEWRHAQPSAAHSFVSPCSGSLSRTSHRKDNNLLSKVKAESSRCVSSLRTEQADLAETQKSLAAVVIAHSRQSNNDDGESRHEVNSGVPSKRTGFYIRSAKRFITGCDDKERMSERIVKEFVNVLALWS